MAPSEGGQGASTDVRPKRPGRQAQARSRYGPLRSQCHASTRSPVHGCFRGLYCNHASRMPRHPPAQRSNCLSDEIRCAIASPDNAKR